MSLEIANSITGNDKDTEVNEIECTIHFKMIFLVTFTTIYRMKLFKM